jgi:glycosyltransferase involved in cell wall biosynthesis
MALLRRPRRLALFCHRLDDRTLARVCVTVAGELAELGCQVSLVATRVDDPVRASVPPGIEVVDLRAPVDKTTFAVPALARWLRRARPDALFSQHNGPNRAAILARGLARVPTAVITVEQNHYSTYIRPSGGGRSMGYLRDAATRFLYARAARVAGVAPEVVADLAWRFPGVRGKTAVLPNPGPDPAQVAALAAPSPGHPWCERPRDHLVVCSIANIIPRKGQDVLIEALPEIRRRAGDVRLLFVGRHDNADYLATLERRAVQVGVSPWISFVGYRDNPLPYLARSDAFALASRNEGAPLVLLEAMACGLPIAATDCPSGPAHLLEAGRYGRLVPVDDPAAMAGALVEVLTDVSLRERLIDGGRRRAAAFAPRRVAEAYLALAEECLAAAGASPAAERRDQPAHAGSRSPA